MEIAEASIITSLADSVKGQDAYHHQRVSRADIAVRDIAPEIRARCRHVAHRMQKRQSVRIPAMQVSEWGQFLRGLELKRALA